jgi:hypothetical protein
VAVPAAGMHLGIAKPHIALFHLAARSIFLLHDAPCLRRAGLKLAIWRLSSGEGLSSLRRH